MPTPIATYVINFENSFEAEANALSQFVDKKEFKIEIVKGQQDENRHKAFWRTLRGIISERVYALENFILVCEADHQFTSNYSTSLLYECIDKARELNADILCGGAQSIYSLFQVTNSILWIEKTSGLQFVVIFRNFFEKILSNEFGSDYTVDEKISRLALTKLLIFPFVSTRADLAIKTRKEGIEPVCQSKYLGCSESKINKILQLDSFYQQKKNFRETQYLDFENVQLPVYVINLRKRIDRLNHIQSEFIDRTEFEVHHVNANEHKIGAVGLWLSIREVIKKGLENDDDILIFCEDDHSFTDSYSKDKFFFNILEAHKRGVDILSCGVCGGISSALPVLGSLLWIDHFWCTQFTIIFKKFFKVILDAAYDDSVTADDLLSNLTVNKMAVNPPYSIQKEFGYTDVSDGNLENGVITKRFCDTSARLSKVQKAYFQFQNQVL